MEHSESVLHFIESRGDSVYKVAKEAGISQSTFSKWKSKPTSKIDTLILEKIANYYGTSIDELLGRKQKNKPAVQRGELIDEIMQICVGLPEEKQLALLNTARCMVEKKK